MPSTLSFFLLIFAFSWVFFRILTLISFLELVFIIIGFIYDDRARFLRILFVNSLSLGIFHGFIVFFL